MAKDNRRRTVLKGIGVGATSLLAGCVGGTNSQNQSGTGKNNSNNTKSTDGAGEISDEVDIGYLLPLSASPKASKIEKQTIQLTKKNLEDKYGATINLHIDDTEGSPQTAISKVKKLVTQDDVDAICGCQFGTTMDAVGEWATRNNVFFLGTGGHGDQSTNSNCAKYYFRFCNSTTMTARATAQSFKKLDAKKWFILHIDNSWGQSGLEVMSQQLPKLGLKMVGSKATSQGQTDYSKEINTIEQSGADGIVNQLNGPGNNKFVQQLNSKGVLDKYQLAGPYYETEWSYGLPNEVAAKMGVYGFDWAADIQQTPEIKKWAKQIRDRYNRPPSARDYLGNGGLTQLINAIAKTDSRDAETLRQFLEGHDFSDEGLLKGKQYWRKWDHQAIRPVYVMEPLPLDKMTKKKRFQLLATSPGDKVARTKNESKCFAADSGWD